MFSEETAETAKNAEIHMMLSDLCDLCYLRFFLNAASILFYQQVRAFAR